MIDTKKAITLEDKHILFTRAALWTKRNRRLRGFKYTFIDYKNPYRHRPFLSFPLAVQSRVKCYRKSRQAGVSESSVSEVLWAMSEEPMNVVYSFPTPKQVEDFSNTRVKTALNETPETRSLIGEIQNVTLRQIGKGFLFLRSATNEKLGEGINADMVVFDEIDRMRMNVKVAFQESLSSSRFGWVREVSTPTLPGRGVDDTWQKSKQYTWKVECETCGKMQPLKFPDNIYEIKPVPLHERVIPEGSYAFCCSRCKSRKIDRWNGMWIAAYPDRDIAGFHINQLMCTWITADQIMQKKRDYKFPSLFWNYVLGEVYMDDAILLSESMVERCMDSDLRVWGGRTAGYDRIIAGVDWGNLNWCVVIGMKPDGRMDLLDLKVAQDGKEPLASTKEIVEFLKPYDPDQIVADWGFGKDRVLHLLNEFHGRVYGCYYLDDSRQIVPVFNDTQHKVTVDRVSSLKSLSHMIRERKIRFPNYDNLPSIMQTFVKHLTSLALLYEEDERGEVIEKIDHIGDDHFAHALNYCLLGTMIESTSPGFEFAMIG